MQQMFKQSIHQLEARCLEGTSPQIKLNSCKFFFLKTFFILHCLCIYAAYGYIEFVDLANGDQPSITEVIGVHNTLIVWMSNNGRNVMTQEMAFLLGTSFMIQSIVIILTSVGIILCINGIFYDAAVNSNTIRGNCQLYKQIQKNIICKLVLLTTATCCVFITGTVFCYCYCFKQQDNFFALRKVDLQQTRIDVVY